MGSLHKETVLVAVGAGAAGPSRRPSCGSPAWLALRQDGAIALTSKCERAGVR